MYVRTKTISTRIGLLFAFLLVLTGCFKKIEEVDHLNTNIFDREYEGEQWYEIADAYFYTNILGQNKARAELVIPEENVPELRPSNITIYATGDGIDPFYLEFPHAADGDYKAVIDLPYEGMITYCISLSIYVSEEDDTVNTFEDCYSL